MRAVGERDNRSGHAPRFRGSRFVLAAWGSCFALLMIVAAISWLFLGPIIRMRATLAEVRRNHKHSRAVTIERLGGPEEACARLTVCLGTSDLTTSDNMRMLTLLGTCGKPAVPVLMRFLRHDDPAFRQSAAEALFYIGPQATEAVPVLLTALRDINVGVRVWSISALRSIETKDAAVLIALQELFADDSGLVRVSAYLAYFHLAEDVQTVVAGLIIELDGDDRTACIVALAGLGSIGPPAESAVPVIEKLVEDAHPDIRKAAKGALNRIQNDSAQERD